MMDTTFPLVVAGAVILLLAIFFYHFLLLCAVPALDFGESIGGEYFFASVVSDANP